jgi:hypothetical protein
MDTQNHISYVKREAIDSLRWDQCIERSDNSLLYAQTVYLDHMATNWDALVLNDYEAVMPLTWNKKFGFYYLHQPFFTPVLGVFGENGKGLDVNRFLEAVPAKFRYWDFDLNESNLAVNERPGLPLKITGRTNYFLTLEKPHEQIRQDYKRLATRMQKKAEDQGLELVRDITPAEVIRYYQLHYKNVHPGIKKNLYERLTACTSILLDRGMAKSYAARSADGTIDAFYLILLDSRHIYSLVGGSTKKGREKGAFYFLTDAVLKDHAQTRRIFRFEGSDLPGIAFFDAQFGPEKKSYTRLVMNKLPFPVNLLKK